jgi:hypothetical protein
MRLFPRVLAIGVAFLFIAASCGASTGEGAASAAPAAAATKAPVTPAAAAAPKFLIVTGDTIRSNYKLNPEQIQLTYPGIHCTQQSRFPQGGRIVWRMKVIDPTTGKPLDDKAIASFTITFPDGKSDKFAYGGHGGTKEAPQDYLWAVGYTIPTDYPTGAFNVKIEAKSVDGATGTFDQFKVTPAQRTIVPAETK